MEKLVQHPFFWFGVVAGWILTVSVQTLFPKPKKKKGYEIYYGKAEVEKMLGCVRRGDCIDLDQIYPWAGKRKDKTTPGYRAWQGMAFWLAETFAKCEFAGPNVTDFWNLVHTCFGDSAAYIKMQALYETINRSTNYYLCNGLPYKSYEKHDFSKLYDMVDMIIDSFAPEVYENCRIDNK